ncbi:helix-turn-helix domain-containing protein [Paenibacillus sp. 5J-6]|uniref:Helix-turn-helix domain-containing protein n=1 Tax=Paenibacillus silvestris TaxID=2606219 RepID=A0A6L8V9J1_9BACL|nr:AraC family transcriptional regulator [Paenibacillus silvestris]MZQ86286.1 helix-turn-helix domain-containing protein [Paenibacillus silvestris]
MCAKRHIETTPSNMYLTPDTPIFVNRVSESFELAEHDHEFFEINYVSEGSGFHYIEGLTLPVAKGDLFFLPIGVSHVFRPASAQPRNNQLIVYNCLFDSTFASKLADFFAGDRDIIHLLTAPYPEQAWVHWKDRDGSIQSIINTLFEEFVRKRPDYLQMMQLELIRILMHIRRCESGDLDPPVSNSTDIELDHVIDIIRDRVVEPMQIGKFALMVGLSERQFRRRFVKRTGMNYTDFVHKLRVEWSCRLLVSTDYTVSSIAQKVGYQDIKFFNLLFKKKTGMTPKQYRSMENPKST